MCHALKNLGIEQTKPKINDISTNISTPPLLSHVFQADCMNPSQFCPERSFPVPGLPVPTEGVMESHITYRGWWAD